MYAICTVKPLQINDLLVYVSQTYYLSFIKAKYSCLFLFITFIEQNYLKWTEK